MSLHVLILSGGISHERDVSLRGGERVAYALRDAGIDVTIREPDDETFGWIADHRPDVVWPMLHGASGEDGALRSLLEHRGIPFVGAHANGARLAWDKAVAKSLVDSTGIAVAPSITLARETFRELNPDAILPIIVESLGLPLVVKPVSGGSSHGISIVRDGTALPRAMVDAFSYRDTVLIESFVGGTEIAIGMLDLGDGAKALPPVEIVPQNGVYSYEARYTPGATTFYCPPRFDSAIATRARRAAETVHTTLELGTISRIDFIIRPDGSPVFLEANVQPGFTETSSFPLAIEGSGRSLTQAVVGLINASLTETPVA